MERQGHINPYEETAKFARACDAVRDLKVCGQKWKPVPSTPEMSNRTVTVAKPEFLRA
jgi:hypothetical protein